ADAAHAADRGARRRPAEWAVLAVLIASAPKADMVARLARLRGDPPPLGLAHAALAETAAVTTVERAEREYFNLFIGIGRGEILPYGSHYLTGFPYRRPPPAPRAGAPRPRRAAPP